MSSPMTPFSSLQRVADEQRAYGFQSGLRAGRELEREEIREEFQEIFVHVLKEVPSSKQLLERIIAHFKHSLEMEIILE